MKFKCGIVFIVFGDRGNFFIISSVVVSCFEEEQFCFKVIWKTFILMMLVESFSALILFLIFDRQILGLCNFVVPEKLLENYEGLKSDFVEWLCEIPKFSFINWFLMFEKDGFVIGSISSFCLVDWILSRWVARFCPLGSFKNYATFERGWGRCFCDDIWFWFWKTVKILRSNQEEGKWFIKKFCDFIYGGDLTAILAKDENKDSS